MFKSPIKNFKDYLLWKKKKKKKKKKEKTCQKNVENLEIHHCLLPCDCDFFSSEHSNGKEKKKKKKKNNFEKTLQ